MLILIVVWFYDLVGFRVVEVAGFLWFCWWWFCGIMVVLVRWFGGVDGLLLCFLGCIVGWGC